MSSWMISKLNLQQSGQSVVELMMPTANNLKYQCPTADFIKFVPKTNAFLSLDNNSEIIYDALSNYYSSLRVGDVISVYSKNKEFSLQIDKISAKDTKYTPKCVKLMNNCDLSNNLMIAFGEAPKMEESKQNDAEIESDGEWEIVNVERVESIDDLRWSEPQNESKNDDKSESEWKCPQCGANN